MSDKPGRLDQEDAPLGFSGAQPVHQGYLHQYVSWGLMQCWQSLTPREREVVILVCQNYTNTQIAKVLVVSPETIRSQVKASLRKFGVQNRVELRWLLSDWQFDRRDGVSRP